jgi:uridine kinase
MTPHLLIWINGFPGSGKPTAANALVNLVGEDKIHLIDNHQFIDAVEAKTTRSTPNY